MFRTAAVTVLLLGALAVTAGAQKDKSEEDGSVKKTLLGTWKVAVGPTYKTEWTFQADGVVLSSEGQGKGRWEIDQKDKRVLLVWNKKDWDSLSLPLNEKESTGKTSDN